MHDGGNAQFHSVFNARINSRDALQAARKLSRRLANGMPDKLLFICAASRYMSPSVLDGLTCINVELRGTTSP